MTHLPELISDLALILIAAGITTLVFKKLKQPLVLGYIVAGFLAGPHFDLFFTVAGKDNIHTWAEIGIIFLLFALGLEFSLKKLSSVGHTAVITAITEVLSMLVIGYGAAQLMGWNVMDSIFLGGMLSMSSTTIIIKAFDDLKLKGQRFTELVFGSLIVEDIAGIVMMVMLSTMAGSAEVSELHMLASLAKLSFFLILWFLMGIFIIPIFFRYVRKDMNDETMLIVALGMCLGMVVLANYIGFSSALGAFITGSILSGTRESDRIEHLLAPVKDLFGAVFFVSVGMMVDPAHLVTYAFPIFVVVIATIIGKLIFSSLGLLLSGEDLKTSLQGGFSLAQIGEFAFIIAGLGLSLGITSDFIYPIVVAVSVITTFTTPFFVGLAAPAHTYLQQKLPTAAKDFLDRYTSETPASEKKDRDWRAFLKQYFTTLVIHSVILTAIVFLAFSYGPLISRNIPGVLGITIETIVPLVLMSPFLKDLLFNKNSRPELVATLWFKKKNYRLPLLVLLLLRVVIAIAFILVILFKFLPIHPILTLLLAFAIANFIYSSDWLLGQYLRLEASFIINLNEKHLRERKLLATSSGQNNQSYWLDQELHIAMLRLDGVPNCTGRMLKDLGFREKIGVNIIQIIRGGKHIDMPGGKVTLKDCDTLIILGTEAQIKLFCDTYGKGFTELHERITLRDFVMQQSEQHESSPLLCCAIVVDEKSDLIGKSIKDSEIRDEWHCLVLGLERGVYTTINPHISLIFQKNDILWVIGKQEMIGELAREDLL